MSAVEGPVLLAIAAGAVLGSLGRWAVGLALPFSGTTWPWATFAVNLSGCLAMGLLVAYLVDRPGTHPLARPFVGVGLLGGWTTFSAFAVEVVRLSAGGHGAVAAGYVAASVVGGVLAVALGATVGQRLWPGP